MTPAETIPTNYEQAVQTLAAWHADLEHQDLEIYSFPDPEARWVRLIEVSDEFARTGRILPVTFGASSEFPFKSSVVLVTPAEWEAVLQGDLLLPEGWDLAQRQRIWPNAGA